MTNPVAIRLREARLRAGLSQSQAAKKAGIPRRTLQNWEQGRNVPGDLLVRAYLQALTE